MIVKFEAYKTYTYPPSNSILTPKIKTCWLVPSKYVDEFGGALVSIGMSDDEIEFWTTERYKDVSNRNKILIFYDDGIWTWSPSLSIDDSSTNFKGEVIPSKNDINKWKFIKTLNKYNI